MEPQELHLDPNITTWVVLPILWVMLCFGIIRFYAVALLQQVPLEQSSKEHTQNSYIKFAQNLMQNGNILRQGYPNCAKSVAGKLKSGSLLAKPEIQSITGMMNPLAIERMMGQFRMQAFTYIPQMIIMKWISLYFAGLVVMKLPFPLTNKFKELLQSGIYTRDLDVQWVSSISWYILLFIGSDALLSLVLPPQVPPPSPVATLDSCKRLSEQLTHTFHNDCYDGIEETILSM